MCTLPLLQLSCFFLVRFFSFIISVFAAVVIFLKLCLDCGVISDIWRWVWGLNIILYGYQYQSAQLVLITAN